MVKTRHQKPKPKKQPRINKERKLGDNARFKAQLGMLGLKIVEVFSDGNCFFRAVADQLEGNEEEHEKYRKMVVQYILKSRESFEPFIEDDVPFEKYCQEMEKDGTWAGHMELQAASLVTHSNICIHRSMSPRWYIRNFDQHGVRMIHLSYHDGEHYNSVRSEEDPGEGPARPITIKADADLSATSHKAKDAVSNSRKGPEKNMDDLASIKIVMAGSGCENATRVEQVLQQLDGDVDAAIEVLIAKQGTEENSAENDSHIHQADISNGCHENGIFEQHKEQILKSEIIVESSDVTKQKCDSISSQKDDKKVPRNKVCPCGSKKKYKACCGAAAGKSSAKNLVDQAVDSGKGRKDRKKGKKVGAGRCESGATTPDLGALCI